MIYVLFERNAREAMNFYAEIFGGELRLFTHEQFNRDEGTPEAIAHAELRGVVNLGGADVAAGQSAVKTQGLMLSLLGSAKPEIMRQWFEQLCVDGEVIDPLSLKPWGATDGQVRDRFGLHWLVGFEVESA